MLKRESDSWQILRLLAQLSSSFIVAYFMRSHRGPVTDWLMYPNLDTYTVKGSRFCNWNWKKQILCNLFPVCYCKALEFHTSDADFMQDSKCIRLALKQQTNLLIRNPCCWLTYFSHSNWRGCVIIWPGVRGVQPFCKCANLVYPYTNSEIQKSSSIRNALFT